jgi:hypothetical protein
MDFTPNTFTPNFECKLCGITCNKQSDWNRHIVTNKHKHWLDGVKSTQKSAPLDCEICNKIFSSKYELKKHMSTKLHEKNISTKSKPDVEKIPETPDLTSMIMEMIKSNNVLQQQNQELQKQILEICKNGSSTTITNNNNNQTNKFNINVFLNETCKNAMNLSDFIKNIDVSREDLENNAQLGFVGGISKIFLDNLRQLSVNERPIHCTDLKRETMYIKDDDKWTKETGPAKLNTAILTISQKSTRTLLDWKKENPDYNNHDSEFSTRCIVIQRNSMAGFDRDTYYPKVIKAIAKEVMV